MHNTPVIDKAKNKTLSGILFMILHALAMAVMYVPIKKLGNSFDPPQLSFLYKSTILVCVLPWCLQGNFKTSLRTRRIGLHIARGTFSLLGTLCFFKGLQQTSILNTAAITYLEQIVIILVGFWYFKEKASTPKTIMIILSLLGAFLIIKPGFVEFNSYYFFLFLAVFFWALNNTVIKMLGSTERTKAQLFYMMLFSSMFSFPFALMSWKPIELEHIKYILVIAAGYLVHYIAFFKALKYADISTVMPFDYSRLLFTGFLGFFFLSEVPDTYSLIGYVMIVIGGVYLVSHETRTKRKPTEAQKVELEAKYEQI